jgi:hypothetical protein
LGVLLLTSWGVFIQYPPVTGSNSELVLVLLARFYLHILVKLVFIVSVDGVVHLLRLPFWLRERPGDIYGRLGAGLEVLDRHRDHFGLGLGCHGGVRYLINDQLFASVRYGMKLFVVEGEVKVEVRL